MRRREFIVSLSVAAAWPVARRAEDRIPRLGYLAVVGGIQAAFHQGLRDLGYIDGKTIAIVFRSAEGEDARLDELARELVAENVDVIVTSSVGVYAARRATATIPIVMAVGGDIVTTGLVETLAHPGGNITGQAFFAPELYAKRLQLLKDVDPAMARAGVMMRRANPSNAHILETMATEAKALNMALQPIEVDAPDELESAIAAAAEAEVTGLITSDTRLLVENAAALAAAAAKRKIALIGHFGLAAKGGLIGYGAVLSELWRHAASFVDKILKGANPADLPIEQATKFRMVVNLNTAKTLGLEIPPLLLAGADEVIE